MLRTGTYSVIAYFSVVAFSEFVLLEKGIRKEIFEISNTADIRFLFVLDNLTLKKLDYSVTLNNGAWVLAFLLKCTEFSGNTSFGTSLARFPIELAFCGTPQYRKSASLHTSTHCMKPALRRDNSWWAMPLI